MVIMCSMFMVTREEMMTFSAQMHRMAERKLPFERLVVDASLALKIFQVRLGRMQL